MWCTTSCTGGTASATPSASAIVTAVFRELDLPAPIDDDVSIVYVVEFDDEPLSVDDQVAVIQELADEYDLRFVDEIEAVAGIAEDGSYTPPLDGPLVAIGQLNDDRDVVVVRAEVMSSTADADAWQISLRGTDDVRVVAIEETEPELLVAPAIP